MFKLLEDIEEVAGEKIGWMYGFVWNRNQIFYYEDYKQVWHGEDEEIIPEILLNLEETRQYSEHMWVDALKLVVSGIRLISFIVAIIQIFTGITDGISFTKIVITILMGILGYGAKALNWIARRRINKKLVELLEAITDRYRDRGLEVRFPKYEKKFCVFLTCLKICGGWHYDAIEIWSFKNKTV